MDVTNDPSPSEPGQVSAETASGLVDDIRAGEALLRAMRAREGDIRAAADRIAAPGSDATGDARTVAAAWLAEHPAAGGGPCEEIEDTPGACAPDV